MKQSVKSREVEIEKKNKQTKQKLSNQHTKDEVSQTTYDGSMYWLLDTTKHFVFIVAEMQHKHIV